MTTETRKSTPMQISEIGKMAIRPESWFAEQTHDCWLLYACFTAQDGLVMTPIAAKRSEIKQYKSANAVLTEISRVTLNPEVRFTLQPAPGKKGE